MVHARSRLPSGKGRWQDVLLLPHRCGPPRGGRQPGGPLRSAPRSSSSGEEVGTPGRTISLLRPKLASCPKNFAFGLIKRRAEPLSKQRTLPYPTSFLYCRVRTLRSNGEPTEPTANALTI